MADALWHDRPPVFDDSAIESDLCVDPSVFALASPPPPSPPQARRSCAATPSTRPPAAPHGPPVAVTVPVTDHRRHLSRGSSSASPLARTVSQDSVFGSPASGARNMDRGDSPDFKSESFFMDMDDTSYLDSAGGMPVGEQAMGDLSLNALDAGGGSALEYAAGNGTSLQAGLFADSKPDHLSNAFRALDQRGASQHANGDSAFAPSPQMTVQPEKMFQLGGSREDSPTSVGGLLNSHENSPAPFSTSSPMSGNLATADGFTTAPPTNYSNTGLAFERAGGAHQRQRPSMSSSTTAAGQAPSKWPCRLTVDHTPDKSRVETQIPIKLTLYDCPPGVTKIHLPPHTISKPKFQARPAHQAVDDTLELSTMLVCASAMAKEGLKDRAMQRALSDEVPVRKEESVSSTDENDPDKPLNGGPVTICPGCIVRERKRAARKKTKKVDEEEEWAKDEAKRVIVFNCPEVRDWCVPGTKDVAVKDHDTPTGTAYVSAPMRIACYCRHQNEKTGFQVIFTLKTASGTILAQAISNSIMITDDHKQPIQGPGQTGALGFGTGSATQMPQNALFSQAYQMMPTFQQNMPFRTSFSTNDLTRFQGQQFAQMARGMSFNRSGYPQHPAPRSQTSTAAPTPRNLSRPASPTDPTGHSTKKRRSGGPTKVPSGLTMTRLDTQQSPSSANSTTPRTGTAPSTAYSFASPTAAQFSSYDDYQQSAGGISSNPYASGPSTPHYGSPPPTDNPDQYQYFSAPTSQHASRAPSPNPTMRMPSNTSFPQQTQVPQAAARALESLPPGLNIQRPPLIQRIIPAHGPRSGGDEVTILGTGFFQSLEVMFGDVPAAKTTFWGDTSLVCEVPASTQLGAVEVVFRHQHRSAPQVCRDIQGLMPGQTVKYTYTPTEEDKNHARLQQLSAGIMQAPQHGGIDPTQLNQNMMGGVLQSPSGFAGYMGSEQMGRMPHR